VAAKRKVVKKAAAKKSVPKPKPRPARAKAASDEQREVHYSDLRKVMLASVLKRLR
jgi:hypothetical protein